MREIFVIYNSGIDLPDGGHPIDGGAGRIDRKWDKAHKDGSTMGERIPEVLAKKLSRKVVYLPDQDLPDPERHKIKDGKKAELTEQDREAIKAVRPKSEVELLKQRIKALEDQLST